MTPKAAQTPSPAPTPKWPLRRWLSKAKLVVLHSFHSLIAPLLAALISAWVIRVHSPGLWGAFVDILLVVQLGAHVLAFGNKELLLRAFSVGATTDDPDAAVPEVFQGALTTRAALLLGPVALLVCAWGWWRNWPISWLLLALAWLPAQLLVQSHDVVILYARRFAAGVAIEATATLATLGGVMILGADLTVTQLLGAFVFAAWGKALLLSVGLGNITGLPTPNNRRPWRGRLQPSWLKLALPFFVMGLTGMLQSRIDLYVITAVRPPHEVANYQVMINLLIYLQAIANFVVLPFVQDYYALSPAAFQPAMRKARRGLAAGGLLFTVLATGLLAVALRMIWRMDLSGALLAVAASYIYVVWLWLPNIYLLYKFGRERDVFIVNAMSTALNFGLNIWLVPSHGILAALAASSLVQWLGAAIFSYRAHMEMTAAMKHGSPADSDE